jgi:hypothetical protein
MDEKSGKKIRKTYIKRKGNCIIMSTKQPLSNWTDFLFYVITLHFGPFYSEDVQVP